MQVLLNANMDNFAIRVRNRRKELGLNQTQLAEMSGLQQSDVSKIESGRVQRTASIVELAKALQCPPEWLLMQTDDGPISAPLTFGEPAAIYQTNKSGVLAPKPDKSDTILIHQYDTGGAMGHGLVLQGFAGVIHSMEVSREWVRLNLRQATRPENLCIVTGFGDSMRGMYNPGDPLIVDTGVKAVEFDAVYFFRVANEGFIKRLQRVPGEGLIAISENKAYRDWSIKPDMDFEVFGRVLKAWKSEDF